MMKYLLVSFGVFLFFLVNGQQDLPVDEIEVIKHFDARLIDAEKIRLTPRLPEADTGRRAYVYKVSMVTPQITYDPPQIRPLALRPEEQPKTYNGHLRGGYGAPNAILADVSYTFSNGPLMLGISGFHQSANEKKTPLKQRSRSGGELHAAYEFVPEAALSGGVSYTADKVWFYGMDANDPTIYVDEHRTFRTFRLGAGLQNADPLAGDMHYKAELAFYDHQDDLGTEESGVRLALGGEKRFAERHVASFDFEADLSEMTDSEERRDLDNLSILPAFAYHGDNFMAKAGVNIASNNSDFIAFPTAELFVQVAGNRLGAFVQVDGGLQKNNFLSLSSYNPFIHERIDSIGNTVYREYGGGVRGKSGKFDYEAKFSYLSLEGLVLFEQDFFDYRKFQPLYDDGKAYRITGNVRVALTSTVALEGNVAQTIYDLDNQDKAWHLPGFRASLRARHQSLNKKLYLRGGLEIESGAPYRTSLDDYDTLKGMFDLSLGAEYYFIENIGAFLHVNNILGRKNVRWEGYADFGLNGVAGILLRI